MFKDNVHLHFGLPEHILSDRGTQFTGLFNQVLAEHLGYDWELLIHPGLMVRLRVQTD